MDLVQSVSSKFASGPEGERQRELWEAVHKAFADSGENGATEEIRKQWKAKEQDLLQLIKDIRDSL